MKYSIAWIQEHLTASLPPTEEIVRAITLKSFEVEGVEAVGNDTILDIKVLPDRAHDALSHRGMAAEIAALFDIGMKSRSGTTIIPTAGVRAPAVAIEDPVRSPRYIGVCAENVRFGPSPDWLIEKLAAVGQRSIGNVVDITNFILFDLGQPMHAFDAKKVTGTITVRAAKKGEQMTTLDGKTLTFLGSETVIADDEAPLALAGVKGGVKAEIDDKTTSIIFESANFDPTTTRRTATLHNIKTDASKRYENGITSRLAEEGMLEATRLLAELSPGSRFSERTDRYPVKEGAPAAVSVFVGDINRLLGAKLAPDDVRTVLKKLSGAGFTCSEQTNEDPQRTVFSVTPSVYRKDIVIPEDLIEEIGRHYGYDRIEPALPALPRHGIPEKAFCYAHKMRSLLVAWGYSEVFTYSFAVPGEGDVEVLNPVGKDRPYLRRSLTPGLDRALVMNKQNAPLFESEDIRIFEIGKVFTPQGERLKLAVGAMGGTKKRWRALECEFRDVLTALFTELGIVKAEHQTTAAELRSVAEFDLDKLIQPLVAPESYKPPERREERVTTYHPFSSYPFIVRDVALWVPIETKAEDVEKIIRANSGNLAGRIYLFDTFEKEGRKSYAFRIVLQSFERTLEDAEANAVYDKVVAALRKDNAKWEVRA